MMETKKKRRLKWCHYHYSRTSFSAQMHAIFLLSSQHLICSMNGVRVRQRSSLTSEMNNEIHKKGNPLHWQLAMSNANITHTHIEHPNLIEVQSTFNFISSSVWMAVWHKQSMLCRTTRHTQSTRNDFAPLEFKMIFSNFYPLINFNAFAILLPASHCSRLAANVWVSHSFDWRQLATCLKCMQRIESSRRVISGECRWQRCLMLDSIKFQNPPQTAAFKRSIPSFCIHSNRSAELLFRTELDEAWGRIALNTHTYPHRVRGRASCTPFDCAVCGRNEMRKICENVFCINVL